jgi:hypothetical protein
MSKTHSFPTLHTEERVATACHLPGTSDKMPQVSLSLVLTRPAAANRLAIANVSSCNKRTQI